MVSTMSGAKSNLPACTQAPILVHPAIRIKSTCQMKGTSPIKSTSQIKGTSGVKSTFQVTSPSAWVNRIAKIASGSIAGILLGGCVSATVDEMTFMEPTAGIGDSSVVILGRRHAPDYDTEFEFIECIGDHIRSGDKSITVLHEIEFINMLYPWFEPRTAPMRTQDIDKLLQQPPVADKFAEIKLEYMIWVDGTTIETNSSGSMTCGVGPGGAGCFGFGTWGNTSDYEATIWDFTDQTEVGRISANTTGQSYMPAVVVPIPIIAPVQGTACDSLGEQLLKYLSANH